MTDSSQQRVVPPQYGPPKNEIPAVLGAGVVWHGEGTGLAVPSLLVYSAGAELLILYLTKAPQPQATERVRATDDALRGLKVNGRSVDLLGGEYHAYGFSQRAWVAFHEGDLQGLTFTLDWPGIEPARHRVDGLQEAVSQVTVLWPSDGR